MKNCYRNLLLIILCLLTFTGCIRENSDTAIPEVLKESLTTSEASQDTNKNETSPFDTHSDSDNEASNTEVSITTALIIQPDGKTLEERFAAPAGYTRTMAEENSLTAFLRNYTLKEHGSPVLLYNGEEKPFQTAHAAVFTLPLENADLQQCADSIMRVYAEYYYHSGQYDKISFHFTNGFECSYQKWMDGYRVKISGNDVMWEKSADYDASYDTFVKYMRIVFSYAGTLSMETYESDIIALSDLSVGDIILKGGSPGHVVMVVDVCENKDGEKAFLLAQGYMPAQEFHVLNNPAYENDPWYYEKEIAFPLKTSAYTFSSEDMLRRLRY